MIETVIYLIIVVMIFCAVAYGLKWVCANFGLPQPVLWICGVLLLCIILLFLANQFGGAGAPVFQFRQVR